MWTQKDYDDWEKTLIYIENQANELNFSTPEDFDKSARLAARVTIIVLRFLKEHPDMCASEMEELVRADARAHRED